MSANFHDDVVNVLVADLVKVIAGLLVIDSEKIMQQYVMQVIN